MIEDIIVKQSKDIREKSLLSSNRVVIPTTLKQSEIRANLKPKLEEKGHNLEKALYNCVEQDKKKLPSIAQLLVNNGR